MPCEASLATMKGHNKEKTCCSPSLVHIQITCHWLTIQGFSITFRNLRTFEALNYLFFIQAYSQSLFFYSLLSKYCAVGNRDKETRVQLF